MAEGPRKKKQKKTWGVAVLAFWLEKLNKKSEVVSKQFMKSTGIMKK